jgi:hypothetical protein
VRAARASGASWQHIGHSLAVTRQAACARFSAVDEHPAGRLRSNPPATNPTPEAESLAAVLVPDSPAFVDVVHRTLDFLEHLAAAERDCDPADPAAFPWVLPAPLSDDCALEALTRITDALRPVVRSFADPEHPPRPLILQSDARFQCVPLRRVTVDRADVQVLSDAVRVTARALSPTASAEEPNPWIRQRLDNLARLVEGYDPVDTLVQLAPEPQLSPVDILGPLASLAALLNLDTGEEGALLLDLLPPRAGDTDLALTPAHERAYRRVVARLTQLVQGDPVRRCLR